jgi:putative addiction module component (TIGR02574 family)
MALAVAAGYPHHITQRGNRRQQTFFCEEEATMSTVVAEIEAKIRALSLEDKTDLMRSLITELDGPADADVETAWLKEAQRRHQEIVEGKVQPVPGERVFANLRARLKR